MTIPSSSRRRVVVVGDVILDVDVTGTSERLSPDAPVPVVDVTGMASRAGGAGLTARMLLDDGHEVVLVTALGDDHRADELRGLLRGITIVAGRSGVDTPVKTRVRVGEHALVRIDESCGPPREPEVTDAMVAAITGAADGRMPDAVIVSDYGRRVAGAPRVRDALREAATRLPVVWDPHPKGGPPVDGAALVTPNVAEAHVVFDAVGTVGAEPAFAAAAAEALVERWQVDAVAVTLGSQGALVRTATGGNRFVPAEPIVTFDTCGAGDRFAGVAAIVLANGGSAEDAVAAGVSAAGSYLGAGGVAHLVDAKEPTKLPQGVVDAVRMARDVRHSGGTVVATGGCFDLLHAGHARTLSAARALGDCLIVCLNSDKSVRTLKGPTRPIVEEDDRAELLLALDCVDAVVVFGETTPEKAIRRIRPHVWVKGGDYDGEELSESDLLREWGGRAVTVPFHPGRSTTRFEAASERVG